MSTGDSRLILLSNSRRGSQSAIYELIEDSESSSSSSTEDDGWVPLSFNYSEQPKKHKSKKKANSHVKNASKETKNETVYFILEEDRHSLVSRNSHHKSHKSSKHLPKQEELSDDPRYRLVAPPSQMRNRAHEHKKYDSEPEPILLPIQRKMRPSHCEGFFEGSQPRRSVSTISLNGDESHPRRRSSSEVVGSVDMSYSYSRQGHKTYSVNQDTKMRELHSDLATSSRGMKKGSEKPETLYEIAIVERY